MASYGQVFGVPQIGNASPLASAKMLVGSSGGVAAPVDLSGAITVTNAGVTTLGASSRLISKVKTATRDLTAAGAPTSVAYTGVGFQPTAIIAFGTVIGSAPNVYTSFAGVVDSAAGQSSLFGAATASNLFATLMTFYDTTGANSQYAILSSFDADGFTLAWTKAGSPTGTATLVFLCLR